MLPEAIRFFSALGAHWLPPRLSSPKARLGDVEHIFAILKLKLRFVNVGNRGLAKNLSQAVCNPHGGAH